MCNRCLDIIIYALETCQGICHWNRVQVTVFNLKIIWLFFLSWLRPWSTVLIYLGVRIRDRSTNSPFSSCSMCVRLPLLWNLILIKKYRSNFGNLSDTSASIGFSRSQSIRWHKMSQFIKLALDALDVTGCAQW